MTIKVSNSFQIPLAGPKDEYIMQSEHLSRSSVSQHRDINLVRLFLQAKTLAELSDPLRHKAIDLCYLDGKQPPNRTSNPHWPRQHTPSKAHIRLWKGYINSSYLRYIPYWKTPPNLPMPVSTNPVVLAPTSFSDLFEFLKSLRQRDRRRLDRLEQVASDSQIWRAFQSKKRLVYIATDGGLALDQGTHGWVISMGNRILFQCAGPVDGPFDTGSSSRCELMRIRIGSFFLGLSFSVLGRSPLPLSVYLVLG